MLLTKDQKDMIVEEVTRKEKLETAISLRLPRQLKKELETLANEIGVSYQPLMRMILSSYVKRGKDEARIDL